ncbi:MAG: class I adenylate-forming enzyme family protein [Desulfobacterales bacterium]|nr:class I adenylate-forming enzyme family protein [Desulfobacterales bacterium]
MAKFNFFNPGLETLFNSYIEKGYWQCSVIDHWEKNARLTPEKEAFVDSTKSLTWLQAKTLSDRLALALLELGLKRDDIVAVQLPWSTEFCLMRAAHEKAGLVQMELAPTLRHQELRLHLKMTETRAIIIPWKYRNFDYYRMVLEIRKDLPRLENIIVIGEAPSGDVISFDKMLQEPLEQKYPASDLERLKHSPFEMGCLRHTTGTTGLSKLVQTNSAALEWAGRAHLTETGSKIDSDTVCSIICPAITGPNIFTFYSSAIVGAKVIIMEHFRPESALELVAREKIHVIGVVPAQLAMMMQHPDFKKHDLTSLRFIVCTGASLNYPLAFQAEKEFGCPIVQHYGSTETGVVTVMQHHHEPQEQRLLTVGRPSVNGEIKLVDESGRPVEEEEAGIIMVKSPTMGFGYYKDPAGSSKTWDEAGWCNMGDLGKLDKKGNLVLVGREKDIIIRGGQNIYPLEIENLLFTHPKILQAAVVSMPDPVMGEKACAFVVLTEGANLRLEEVVSFLNRKHIAPFKIPERLEVIDKFPLAGEQKIDKKALQNQLRQTPGQIRHSQ